MKIKNKKDLTKSTLKAIFARLPESSSTRNKLLTYPAGNYMLIVSNGNTRTRCEICSKLAINIVNFEHTSHLVLVFLLLTLSK